MQAARRPLLVRGGDSAAFAALGRVDWAAALPEFLERLGLGGWEVAALEGLVGEVVVGRPAVLVAFAPESLWGEAAVEALVGFDGPLLVEGPLPASVAERLVGVRVIGEDEQFVGSIVETKLRTRGAAAELRRALERTVSLRSPQSLSALPERMAFRDAAPAPDAVFARDDWRTALAYLRAAAAGLTASQRVYVFPRSVLQGCTLLVYGGLLPADRIAQAGPAIRLPRWSFAVTCKILELVSRAMASERRRLDPAEVVSAVEGDHAPEPQRIDFAALESLALDVMEFLAAAIEYAHTNQPSEVERYRELLDAARGLAAPLSRDRAENIRWALPGIEVPESEKPLVRLPPARLAALRLWADLLEVPVEIVPPPASLVTTPTAVDEALRLKSLAIVAADRQPEFFDAALTAGKNVLDAVEQARATGEVPAGVPVVVADALAVLGAQDWAERLLSTAGARMGESPNGLLRDDALRMGPDVGLPAIGALRRGLAAALAASVQADPVPAALEHGVGVLQHWRQRRRPWPRRSRRRTQVLLEASATGAEKEAWPLLVCRGSIVALSFPLLTWAVAECSLPPPPPGRKFREVSPAGEAFALAAALVEDLLSRSGQIRLLVWPWPAAMGATLRHDVDRIPPPRTLAPILEGEASHRRASTYCFLPDRLATPMRELLEDLGHEIAVHGPDIATMAADLTRINAWAGGEVVGWTAHGTPRGASSTGPRSWLAAEEAGLAYVDFSNRLSGSFPHPPVAVDDGGGRARVLDVELFDIDLGLDSWLEGGRPSGDWDRALGERLDECLRQSDHMCLNNHPDLGGEAHAEMVASVVERAGDRAWWTTLAEAARRRRAVQRVRISATSDGDVELESEVALAGLQLVLAVPDRKRLCLLDEGGDPVGRLAAGPGPGVFALDLAAGQPVRVAWVDDRRGRDLPELTPTRPPPLHRAVAAGEIAERLARDGVRLPRETPFAAALSVLARHVAAEREQTLGSTESEEVKGNLDYNTVDVRRRADGVARFLQNAYGISIAGKSVADLGCGFGGLGLWMLTAGGAARLACFEVGETKVRIIREVIGELGLAGASAEQVSLTDLDLPESEFDVALFIDVVQNESFELGAVLAKVARALKPGGAVAVRTGNRWASRDAWTGLKGVHFLRPSVGREALGFVTASESPSAYWRPISPLTLVRSLERQGFVDCRLASADGARTRVGGIHSGFIHVGARKAQLR